VSQTFKRPMFRKGGNVGVGIMSEIQDRKSFQIGSNPFENPLQMDRAADQGLLGLREQITEREVPDFGEERDTAYYLDKLKSGLGEDTSFDPFTQYLLTAGPAVAKATSFADAIARLEKPNLALIEAQEARAKRDRDLGLAAADLSIRRGETLEERKQDYEKTQREQDFILKKFKQETDRLLKLQEKDFSQEEKLLGLKFAQEGTMFDRQADLEKNLLKIKAAIDSDLYDKKQKDRFKELEIQYTNALGLLKEEQKLISGIENTIRNNAEEGVKNQIYGDIGEATRKETWKLKDTRSLRDQGLLVASEPLDPKAVQDEKSLKTAAKKFGKKGNNTNRIYYDWTNDIQYQLIKDGKEYKFVVYDQGTETDNDGKITQKTTESVKEAIEKLPRRSKKEIGEDESYEYPRGSADLREQDRAIRLAGISARGTVLPVAQGRNIRDEAGRFPIALDTRMTGQQKSDYEKFLEEYRNRT
tara:strand:- start:119 stop:1537 length:1419 start_codon:yes stop_codon:yes gene_type:complete